MSLRFRRWTEHRQVWGQGAIQAIRPTPHGFRGLSQGFLSQRLTGSSVNPLAKLQCLPLDLYQFANTAAAKFQKLRQRGCTEGESLCGSLNLHKLAPVGHHDVEVHV